MCHMTYVKFKEILYGMVPISMHTCQWVKTLLKQKLKSVPTFPDLKYKDL